VEKLQSDLKAVTFERDDFNKRFATIANAVKDPADCMKNAEEDTTKPDSVSTCGQVLAIDTNHLVTPAKGNSDRSGEKTWTKEEMRVLYSEIHRTGKLNGRFQWKEVIKALPGVTNIQASNKWNRSEHSNSLEQSFVGEKVASQTPDGKLVGTVTNYVMSEKTRVGTWRITYHNGKVVQMYKNELLAAWHLFKTE